MITFSHYRGLHWRHRGHQRSDTGRKHSHASNALITVCVVARTINGRDNCAHDTARGFWRPVTSLIIVFLPGIRLCTAKSHARTVRPDGRSRLFCFDRYRRKSGWNTWKYLCYVYFSYSFRSLEYFFFVVRRNSRTLFVVVWNVDTFVRHFWKISTKVVRASLKLEEEFFLLNRIKFLKIILW